MQNGYNGMVFGFCSLIENKFLFISNHLFKQKFNVMDTSNSNFETTTIRNEPSRNNAKNIIIGVLAVALVGTAGYLIYDKNQTGQTIQHQQTQIAQVTTEKSDIQKNFDASLARLDSMSTVNT